MRMKSNKRCALISAFLLCLFMSFIHYKAYADGMLLYYDNEQWKTQSEDAQMAAINYREGFEHLIIRVSTVLDQKSKKEKLVWIFPIPAEPQKVDIGIVETFPEFTGEDIIRRSYSVATRRIAKLFLLYGMVPIFFPAFIETNLPPGMAPAPAGGASGGVTIYKSVEKSGLTAELISTQNHEALKQYLSRKGLTIPEEYRTIIDWYVGKDYSFVISYISNLELIKKSSISLNNTSQQATPKIEKLIQIALGIHVKFPADRLFFPMKLTSIYRDDYIPINIFIIGHVTPLTRISQRIAMIKYLSNIGPPLPPSKLGELSEFYGPIKDFNFKYTAINFNAFGSDYTEDLWFSRSPPFKLKVKEFIIEYGLILGFIVLLLVSSVSGLIAGKLILKKYGIPAKRLFLHGLWNGLSFIALIIATFQMKGSVDKDILIKHKIGFILVFNLSFLFLVLIISFSFLLAFF